MKIQRVTLFIALAFTFVAGATAGASVNPTWQAAKNAALPKGATGLYNGNLSVLSCAAPGDCAAAGIDQDASGNTYGLLLNEVDGVWRDPSNVVPPGNADVSYGVSIDDVSCGAPGSCSAVGTYADAAQNELSFVVNEVDGVWQKAVEVTLPANAIKSSQISDLHSIACSSSGSCSAVGTYLATAGANSIEEPLAVTETAGHWGNASEVTLPAGTNYNPFAELNQVACASAGNCAAAGSYIDQNDVTHALVVNQIAGVWRVGTSLAPPANASSFTGANVSEISCARAGDCAAVGTYIVSGGAVEMLADNESNATWAHSIEVQLPASAAANPHVLLYGFGGVACPSVGECVSGGQYQDKDGNYQGFLVNEINGRWQAATQLTLPAGAEQAGKNGGVVALSCVAVGDCTAGAAYEDTSGNYQALVVNETNHVWATGTKVTLPSGASTVGPAGGIYAVDCQKSGTCDAVGSYETPSGNYLGFTDHAS
ncbi:MAG: hypothetical protein WAN30_05010 [Acidimicrobiales bacterium]